MMLARSCRYAPTCRVCTGCGDQPAASPRRDAWRITLPTLAIVSAFFLPSFEALAEQTLPTRFDENRVFLSAKAPDGEELLFYTDTGGGFNAVTQSVAATYSLADRGSSASGEKAFNLVAFPAFLEESGVPAPPSDPWLDGNLAVVPDERLEMDGFLGSRWFAGRIWQFDYPGETLTRITASDVPTGFEEAPLGFRADDSGARDLNFPRITIRINGEPLEMLLDTGATALLTESAAAAYGSPPETRVAASYIIRSKFEQWREHHPYWRVIEEGEAVTGRAFPMIEVPEVQVGGLSVGPVWFSVRPDHTFKGNMSQMMDKQIVGAVGGSLLQYLRMIIDYPGARAYFQLPGNEEPSRE